MNPSRFLDRLIVPLDTSSTAETALHWAALMARDRAMEVHLVTVWDPDAPIPGVDRNRPDSEILQELTSYLEEVARGLRREGVSVTVEARVGDVIEQIRAVTECPGCMLMLASHGEHGYREQQLGSVAEALVRALKIPVLVIPATGER